MDNLAFQWALSQTILNVKSIRMYVKPTKTLKLPRYKYTYR